jgi:hypothetical protein
MQYNPQPIFHCGDPSEPDIKDDPEMVEDRIVEFQVPQAAAAVKKWLAGK